MKEQIIKIKNYFKADPPPYFFISPTNFNLITLHKWIKSWQDINYINCFDNSAKHCIIPKTSKHPYFESLEQINEYLLNHKDIEKLITTKTEQTTGKAIFLFFNENIEKICQRLNLDLILPPNKLVKHIDNKITTTQLGNEANVPSVNNFLDKIDSYETLQKKAAEHNLGNKLVIQTPFGDSGKTTFFISSEDDYNRYKDKIEQEKQVKVMKQVNCVGSAIEACATKYGTYVGPLLSELIGFSELTPYKGGWCGNELYPERFKQKIRAEIHQKTERLGNTLYRHGYRGYFEVDYLIDLDTEEVYLGEINPRITGISAITNMSPFCQKYLPLFFFHLLEYSDFKDWKINPEEFNQLSLTEGAQGTTSQMIFKSTHSGLKIVSEAPESGIYTLENGNLKFIKRSADPTERGDDSQTAYLLRILQPNEYSYKGADTVILFLNEKITTNNGQSLNSQAKQWINAVNNSFKLRELSQEERELNQRFLAPSNIKGNTE